MPSGIVGVAVDVGIQGVVIQGNIVFGGKVGVHFPSGSDGRVEENQISGNVTGVYVVDAAPDLGGGAYDSSGGNSIHQNSGNDMVIEGDLLLFARFNCWDHSPPTQSFMPGTADVILPPGAVLDTSPSSVCSGGI